MKNKHTPHLNHYLQKYNDRIWQRFLTLEGMPYKLGEKNPQRNGIDCSGLTHDLISSICDMPKLSAFEQEEFNMIRGLTICNAGLQIKQLALHQGKLIDEVKNNNLFEEYELFLKNSQKNANPFKMGMLIGSAQGKEWAELMDCPKKIDHIAIVLSNPQENHALYVVESKYPRGVIKTPLLNWVKENKIKKQKNNANFFCIDTFKKIEDSLIRNASLTQTLCQRKLLGFI